MARHFHIEVDNGAAVVETNAAPDATPLDPRGWIIRTLDTAGVSTVLLDAEAGAEEFSMHASPDRWFGQVLAGSGTLAYGNAAGNEVGSVRVAAGDLLTFEPDTPHAWRVESEPLRLLFVKPA
ncbi:MAG: cupin domain-containing protein [Planctomycetota bacterium]